MATPMLTCAVFAIVSAAAQVESAKVYWGGNGQRVEVVTLAPLKDNRALVRIGAAETPFDGLVLPCEVRRGQRSTDYVTRREGGEWFVLRLTDGEGQVAVPGRPEFKVQFDRGATDVVKTDELLAEHEAQRADGRLAMVARKSFPFLEKKYQGQADQAAASVSKRCGRSIAIAIDWFSFEDAQMENDNIWKACQPIAARLESSCASSQGASTVRCRGGKEFSVRADGAALIFTTVVGKSGAAEFLSRQR